MGAQLVSLFKLCARKGSWTGQWMSSPARTWPTPPAPSRPRPSLRPSKVLSDLAQQRSHLSNTLGKYLVITLENGHAI